MVCALTIPALSAGLKCLATGCYEPPRTLGDSFSLLRNLYDNKLQLDKIMIPSDGIMIPSNGVMMLLSGGIMLSISDIMLSFGGSLLSLLVQK